MNLAFAADLPELPVLLWETPPGLELVLAQEGLPFEKVRDPHPLAFVGGRVVLFDGRRVPAWKVRGVLSAEHAAIDVDGLRGSWGSDPFSTILDNRAGHATWRVDGFELVERIARVPKAPIRRSLVERLRERVAGAGGVWARLAPYPHPYRSAFNFRVDLDEHEPDDYWRFARARRPLEDCTTHFVSTRAYGLDREILDDLRPLDTQSHGHYHVVYRDEEANRRNLERAHAMLARAGFSPSGFAAPEGRWNPGLDRAVEGLGYEFSSDFGVGYDDLPFYPWCDGGFSTVLQVPIHPVCEGIFLEAGLDDESRIAAYFAEVVRAKVASGEPAFVYGHPERRLARLPGVLPALDAVVRGDGLVWKVTLAEFARWWRWRGGRRWSLVPRGEDRFEVQLDEWDPRYPLSMEIVRGSHVASIPLRGPRTTLQVSELAFERRRPRVDLPTPAPARPPRGLKSLVRAALDWETITPIEELPEDTLAARLKKRLRGWHRPRRVQEAGGRT
jgi:hypothetical protein